MKYTVKLDLWADGVQEGILNGNISLQRGQWLACGPYGRPCRYIGHNGRTINVVHWQGTTEATEALFKARLKGTK